MNDRGTDPLVLVIVGNVLVWAWLLALTLAGVI